jgi:hypothetical protein
LGGFGACCVVAEFILVKMREANRSWQVNSADWRVVSKGIFS